MFLHVDEANYITDYQLRLKFNNDEIRNETTNVTGNAIPNELLLLIAILVFFPILSHKTFKFSIQFLNRLLFYYFVLFNGQSKWIEGEQI